MPASFKSKYRYFQCKIPVIFVRGYRNAQEPPDFAPQIGAIIFYVKESFCGYLDGPWGLKTCR